jgi:D-amino peptidase
MEGVSGVVSMAQVTPHEREYAEARQWFMEELRALIDGLTEGGATEITIYDEHWFGRNVDLARIPRGVRVLCGKPPYRADWAGGLDASHTGLILHGLHSMEGTGHLLAHTYEPDFRSIHLNGILVGEVGVETAVAGDWGVPLVLAIADSAGAAEAQTLVPGVATVATKISHAAFGAECRSLTDVVAAIREAGRAVGEGRARPKPWRLASPVELLCTFKPGRYLDSLRRSQAVRFVGDDTLRLVGPTTTAVWAEYWQLKLRALAELA